MSDQSPAAGTAATMTMTFTALADMKRPDVGSMIRYGDMLAFVTSSTPLRDDEGRKMGAFTIEVEPVKKQNQGE